MYNPCGKFGGITNVSQCPEPASKQTSFNMRDAYDMVLFANAAYYDNVSSQPLPTGSSVMHTFNYTLGLWNTAHGFVGLDKIGKRAVIAFRGTDAFSQLFRELVNYTLVPHPDLPGALVNGFFLNAAQSLDQYVRKGLQELRETCSDCSLWFTGHSLGGAMAIMMAHHIMLKAADLVQNRTIVAYTFGQPRVGNSVHANSVNELLPRFFRVVNAADVVPHVPACDTDSKGCKESSTGYYHAGTEMWFPHGEYQQGVMCGYRECVGAPRSEDSTCSDRILSPWEPADVPDHHGYFEILQRGFCGNVTAALSTRRQGIVLI